MYSNELKAEDRMGIYLELLYCSGKIRLIFKDKGASAEDLFEYTEMSKAKIEGKSEGFIDI